jgi:multidrug efflux system membrane fusion protein
VLTQIKPVAVQFSLPQQQLARVNAAFAAAALQVEVMVDDGRGTLETGVLHSIDNQVDSATGTVKLKAEFPNASLQLWPGQFVNVRLKVETLTQALVVPTAAVQRGPVGTYAFVVGADDVVSARAVTVTQQNDTEAVVASGLAPGDRVVTTGFANLAEGSKVSVSTSADRPAPDLAPQRRTGSGPAPDSGPRGPGAKGPGKGPGGGGGPPR